MNFNNKKVFITGGMKGIGYSTAINFKKLGAYVIVTGKNIIDKNSAHDFDEAFSFDFTKIDQINDCAKQILKSKPDILINNAGINKIQKFKDIKMRDFIEIQSVNVFAPLLLSQSALINMQKKRWGRIINISSIWGSKSKIGRASYSASKFALHGVTIAMALEFAKDGVIVNCISPGVIDTDLTRSVLNDRQLHALKSRIPLNRLGTPEEISKLIVWLASEDNSYITGQNILIDGGFTCG